MMWTGQGQIVLVLCAMCKVRRLQHTRVLADNCATRSVPPGDQRHRVPPSTVSTSTLGPFLFRKVVCGNGHLGNGHGSSETSAHSSC